VQRILNYYPTHRLYYGEVETPYIKVGYPSRGGMLPKKPTETKGSPGGVVFRYSVVHALF